MSTRFSEVANSRWCKTCNVQILPGDDHPNLEAHLAEIKTIEAANEAITKKMTATSTFIPVSSNDMMRHVALSSSPETLCGKIVTDTYRPSTTDRVCDVCAELASDANFVKTTDEADDDSLRTASVEKEAINYTRDGVRIEDGFTVITSEEAENLPFLSHDKVRVARYECPDCETKTHFERLASCEGCGEFKCVACMNTIGNFIGVCAKCAGVDDSQILVDSFEEPLDTDENFRLLSRLLTEEEEEADPLFLPEDEL